ncbi:outer membrane usher protein [Pseudomonas frederiksbergensis]|uniref:fimbria/pilus outer membrane usher protein n=1 Tax=Pseudomonas frederiksbergensis TaxID=104087 RepID=UPI003D231D17
MQCPSIKPINRSTNARAWRLAFFSALSGVLIFSGTTQAEAQANPHDEFDTSFLQGNTGQVNLEMLLSGNHVLPGNYRVDIFLNKTLVGRRDIDFRANPQSAAVEPCLPYDLIEQMGIDMSTFGPEPLTCYDLPALIPHASVSYDSTHLSLAVSVPQAALIPGLRGYVDASLWDQGIAAAFSNYQFSGRRTETGALTSTTTNLNLRNGLNLGAWRLRNDANLSSATGQPSRFVSNQTYVQRDMTSLKSQLSAGDIYSDSMLFDSVRYRGVKLGSDEGMYADSQRGYAPVIRGIAETNATVEIRQNGFVLYSRNVAPGPFELADIYPSGSNGDLEVTVIETDGRRRTSVQAFSSLPIMVRKGHLNYSLSAGRYASNDNSQASPSFVSSTFVYGLDDNLTGAFGTQLADGFQATSVGAGKNTSIGAVSLDLTHSRSEAFGQNRQGSSVRMLYAKTFTGTATNFTLAAYRYSTEGYRSFNEHVQDMNAETMSRSVTSRTRADLSINQSLGHERQYGSLYFNVSDQRYWNGGGTRSLSASYGNNWRDLSYTLGVSRTQSNAHQTSLSDDTQLTLSMSFPLGSKPRSPRAVVNTLRQGNGQYSTQAGINGYLSDDGDTYYSVQAGVDANSQSGSLSLNSRTPLVEVGAGVSQGAGYRAQSLSASGSVVAHAGGLNFGPQLGETFALVQVPGIEGVNINSYAGAKTAGNGYAVVPNAQPYRTNWISLDTRDLGGNIEIENATQQVVPRRGAVVLATFAGSSGRRVQFELFDAQGQPIPFGAAVENAQGTQLAISDPTGKALALVEQDAGELTLKWDRQQCQAPYQLPERDPAVNYQRARLECRS